MTRFMRQAVRRNGVLFGLAVALVAGNLILPAAVNADVTYGVEEGEPEGGDEGCSYGEECVTRFGETRPKASNPSITCTYHSCKTKWVNGKTEVTCYFACPGGVDH
jgi:hypothetical protein